MLHKSETARSEPSSTQDDAAVLVLNELTRQLDRQSVDISTARTRAIGLISAAGVVNGIFGFSTKASGSAEQGLQPLPIIALMSFALMVALLLPALTPRKFDLRGDMTSLLDSLAQGVRSCVVARSVAVSFDRMIKCNASKIDGLYWCLTAGSILLAAQVLLWAIGVLV